MLRRRRHFQLVAMLLALGGCQSLGYYGQAALGQADIIWRSRPIDAIVARPDTEPELGRKLRLVQELRSFAVERLMLPDSDSYTRYADIGRDRVVWNVFAAPRYGIEADTWCFPVAGCVGYRGYFSSRAAQRFADRLRDEGRDVMVAGVRAYSTLGWFADPVLNTVIGDSEAELAALVFHELAHERSYVKGDTEFNESFASVVEETGVARWLRERGAVEGIERYREDRAFSREFVDRVMLARRALAAHYRLRPGAAAEAGKREILDNLYDDYRSMARIRGYNAGELLPLEHFNNALVSSVALYHRHVAAFRALLAGSAGLEEFYKDVAGLAALDKGERTARLHALAAGDSR